MTDLLEQTPPEPSPVPDGAPEVAPEPPVPGWLERLSRRLASVSLQGWITFAIVAGSVVFTLAQLHPNLLFSNTTPTGGDMGAHVWGPAYLRDHILPHFRLSGWAPDWYAGFPMYQFYMVIPALAVVIVNTILPYGLALKLVSISGVLTLPIAVWAFGKLSGLKFPIPALFSAISVVFLFDETFTIYGGNIASTMAGEFSFSIALSIAFVYFGVLARGLRTGKHRAIAAVLLALCVLCHLIVAIFVAAGTVVWFLLYLDRKRFKWLATMVPVGALLTAFWVVPFFMRRHYLTDMGYERRTDYINMLFPMTWKWDLVLVTLGVIGLVASIVRRSRPGIWLGLMTLIYAAWIVVWPQSMFWNARLTPFYYICRYLLAAIGVAEIGLWVANAAAHMIAPQAKKVVTTLTPIVGAGICVVILGMSLRILPGGHMITKKTSSGSVAAYDWFGLTSTHAAFVDDWAKWNYSGYEGKPAYGEYRGVMTTMQDVGNTYGCGRAEWEYDAQINQYGTPMAMMLLPFWTNGCIGSMEGLFFESSATTPYHFLASSALSTAPSRPVRNLRYDPLDVEKGVKYMQLLGVKYYMAFSPAAVKEARQQKDLREIATSGPWVIFEVANSDIVTPLTNQPVVVQGADKDAKTWLDMSESFFLDPTQYGVELAASGPKEWQRIQTGDTPPKTALDPVTVSNITTDDDRVSFDVDQTGVPVLVKVSYFPNWQASGAEGPWRVAPNLMVVIPTSNHVSLHYGRTPVDLIATFLTLVGIGGVVWLARSPAIAFPLPKVREREDEPIDEDDDFVEPQGWDTWDEWNDTGDGGWDDGDWDDWQEEPVS
ncbi:MAG TPA: hypothetical protein VMK16_14280 [Acidimicrobiales bacterium]|nr:hypothetical protein [Acidimicrobiales bacterium]